MGGALVGGCGYPGLCKYIIQEGKEVYTNY